MFQKSAEKVYAKNDAVLFISEGQLHKFGRLEFENDFEKESQDNFNNNSTPIPLNVSSLTSTKVSKISIGSY